MLLFHEPSFLGGQNLAAVSAPFILAYPKISLESTASSA
jgi:hypothetical protein